MKYIHVLHNKINDYLHVKEPILGDSLALNFMQELYWLINGLANVSYHKIVYICTEEMVYGHIQLSNFIHAWCPNLLQYILANRV